MIFIDGIILSQTHKNAPTLAGIRSIRYRQPGDINRDGFAVEELEAIDEVASWAWIQGSHSTAIRVKSIDDCVALAGNPGRFGKSDNLFGLDLPGTIAASNRILEAKGLPFFSSGTQTSTEVNSCELHYTGARIWSIHITQNFATGSQENAETVLNWVDTQSVARVKKSRLGKSTVVWGSLNYCQTEIYIKADEMLAHAKGSEAKETIRQSKEYQYALENGVVRVEVKAAKDYLREHELTYLGAWDMGTVHRIFSERTEILNRTKFDSEEFNLMDIPFRYRATAAAWLRGEDVTVLFNNRMSLYRHAKQLRNFGIDITLKRNIATFPIRIRTINLVPLSPPDFYRHAA